MSTAHITSRWYLSGVLPFSQLSPRGTSFEKLVRMTCSCYLNLDEDEDDDDDDIDEQNST